MNYPLNEVITINNTQNVDGATISTRGRFIRKWCIVSPQHFIVNHFDDEQTCKSAVKNLPGHRAEIKTIRL